MVYEPAVKVPNVALACQVVPPSILYWYGVAPPEANTVMLPLLPPKQVTLVVVCNTSVNGANIVYSISEWLFVISVSNNVTEVLL